MREPRAVKPRIRETMQMIDRSLDVQIKPEHQRIPSVIHERLTLISERQTTCKDFGMGCGLPINCECIASQYHEESAWRLRAQRARPAASMFPRQPGVSVIEKVHAQQRPLKSKMGWEWLAHVRTVTSALEARIERVSASKSGAPLVALRWVKLMIHVVGYIIKY